jgi:glucarate dehydratase
MKSNRRDWVRMLLAGAVAGQAAQERGAWGMMARQASPLVITGLKVTPIALPDPPIMAASGCHGPYFLRNIIELRTVGGVFGIGETHGGHDVTKALEEARGSLVGQNAFGYRKFARALQARNMAAYAAVEMACIDACARATGRRFCELVGGPVRDSVEFAAYLFFRYAADHPVILSDPRLVDSRGKGERALDSWGEVRTPKAMAEMAAQFRDRWGFRVFKLKGGVLDPDVELQTMKELATRLGPKALLRIDPNGRWRQETAVRIGKKLAEVGLEYYEDPVNGQKAMAEVRSQTGLKMSTNMCVTRFEHIPSALELKPIDVLLCDHHYFGGFAGCQALGPICRAAGWSMSQHSNNHSGVTMAAMIHLGASIPELTLASDTHYPWLVDPADIIEGPKLVIKEGRMAVPTGVALGVTLDQDKLARAAETYVKCGMTGRDDATLMKRLEPGWTGGLL